MQVLRLVETVKQLAAAVRRTYLTFAGKMHEGKENCHVR